MLDLWFCTSAPALEFKVLVQIHCVDTLILHFHLPFLCYLGLPSILSLGYIIVIIIDFFHVSSYEQWP